VVLAFAVIYTSWGTTYRAIQIGVRNERLPPALFGGSRVALAGVILLAFLACRGDSLALKGRDLTALLLSSGLLFVAGNGLINVAEQTVNSGLAAVLVATTPLWIGLCEMFWPGGDRLTARGWLALVIGLGGVFVLKEPTSLGDDWGLLLVLGSSFAWALGSVVVRHRRLSCPHLTAAAYQMIAGGGCLTLLGFALGEWQRVPERLTPGAAATFLYLLIVGSLMGFVAFNWLLGHVPAARVGTYAYVNPVVAVFVGWLAGEEITLELIGGILIILTAVALVRRGERKPAAK
jgi:drug/metabolite transporter (DMT)-like permease